MKKLYRSKVVRLVTLSLFTIFFLWYSLSLRAPLFSDPYSTVVVDRQNLLLGARIASDGQWRFPEDTLVSKKFETCLLEFEDKRFYTHWGIDPLAIARAIKSNLLAGDRISGGSTISMQVLRLSYQQPERTYWQKLKETILATRLEIKYSKKEILTLYASHAPFGGNVVGLETASWKYYQKKASELSWAQSAALAVLPNAPSLIHPGKNRLKLLQKRNALLKRLLEKEVLDSTEYILAIAEPLPEKPLPLPNLAPHLTEQIRKNNPTGVCITTLDFTTQCQSLQILSRHQKKLQANGIYNAAILIADNESGNIVTYVGNSASEGQFHDVFLDMTSIPRSTGSVLKPLLYAASLNEEKILPHSLLPDVPTRINQYNPKNFNQTYEGAVPASQALARSLNIPAIHLLKMFSVEKFHLFLKQTGLSSFHRKSQEYGYTLILGGGEASLVELCSVYASMARTLNHYQKDTCYYTQDFRKLSYCESKTKCERISQAPTLRASSIYATFEAMQEVVRPDQLQHWKIQEHAQRISWKTGTSFGNKDAWAIGCTPDYTVGVWLGNTDGTGRPGLTGIDAAAPLLFDIFESLPTSSRQFLAPKADMEEVEVCIHSGEIANTHCPATRKDWIGAHPEHLHHCPYHMEIKVDHDEKHRVAGDCYPVSDMKSVVYFVLPPQMEQYYRSSHPTYQILPPYLNACLNTLEFSPMQVEYPNEGMKLHHNGQGIIGEANHQNPLATLYWHLDEEYIGATSTCKHQIALYPEPGKHTLTLIDDAGMILKREFEVF